MALLLLLSPYSWTSSLKGTQLTHVQLDVPQNPQFFSTDLFQGAMDGRAAPPIQSLVCKLSFANKTTCPGAFSPSGTLSSFAFSLGYHLPSKQRMTVAFHHLPVVQASACSLRSCLAEHHILQKYMFYRGFLCPSWDLEFLSWCSPVLAWCSVIHFLCLFLFYIRLNHHCLLGYSGRWLVLDWGQGHGARMDWACRIRYGICGPRPGEFGRRSRTRSQAETR